MVITRDQVEKCWNHSRSLLKLFLDLDLFAVFCSCPLSVCCFILDSSESSMLSHFAARTRGHRQGRDTHTHPQSYSQPQMSFLTLQCITTNIFLLLLPQACGVDFEIRAFCAKSVDEKIHKRCSTFIFILVYLQFYVLCVAAQCIWVYIQASL